MKIPVNKRSAPPPPDVEQMLRASAAWEPDAPPPSDFAAFTRKALERRRKPRTVGFVRSPLAVALASVCVLWMGNALHPRPVALNAAPPASGAAISQTQAPHQAAEPAEAAPPQTVPADYRAAAEARTMPPFRRRRAKTIASGRWGHTQTASAGANTGGKPGASAAPLWETEMVERPAWGALVPVPASAECAVPAADAPTGEETSEPTEGEASSADAPPLVLDVALPDMETPMPAPTPASPEK